MVFGRTVKINDSVIAGSRIDDFIRNLYIVGLVSFNLVELGKILIVIALVVNVITHKLHGNGSITVQTLGCRAVCFGAVYTKGFNYIA